MLQVFYFENGKRTAKKSPGIHWHYKVFHQEPSSAFSEIDGDLSTEAG
jgi:hypothetical protein